MNGDFHNGSNGRPPASDPHHWRSGNHDGHDYQVRFYPGFASRIRLRATKEAAPDPAKLAEGATVLYDQQENRKEKGPQCFVLPAGATRPLSSHALELSCASKGFTVGLHIDDPQHVVEGIIVKLRDPVPHPHYDSSRASAIAGGGGSGTAGGGVMAYQDGGTSGGGGGGTTWEIDNTPTLCPPDCP